jgi:Putative lumazine-binding
MSHLPFSWTRQTLLYVLMTVLCCCFPDKSAHQLDEPAEPRQIFWRHATYSPGGCNVRRICKTSTKPPTGTLPVFVTGFGHVWLLTPAISSPYSLRMANDEYLTDYDQIVNTMRMYIDGSKQGKSALMRPAFHPDASFFGYAGDQLAVGTPFLFDWIDKNGPADKIEPRVVSVDILQTIAVVRLDVDGWSGNLAGSGAYMSDLFTLLKTPSGWKIIQKAFHWHS